jgi:hypothetical protein
MLDRYLEQEAPSPYDLEECRSCYQAEQMLDDASEYLDETLKQLYNTSELDKDVLHHCLEELAFLLKVKMPKTWLQVERTSPQKMLKEWVSQNNKYLYKLAQ